MGMHHHRFPGCSDPHSASDLPIYDLPPLQKAKPQQELRTTFQRRNPESKHKYRGKK